MTSDGGFNARIGKEIDVAWGSNGILLQLSLLQSDTVRQSKGIVSLPNCGFSAPISTRIKHFNGVSTSIALPSAYVQGS
jgi:hypothetical protein